MSAANRTPEEQQFVLEVTRELLDEGPTKLDKTGEEVTQTPNKSPESGILVFGCPARDETDELALVMLGKLLDSTKCRFEVISHNNLTAEVVSQVRQQQARAICIASVPPKGLAHTRYLCKRLRAQFPDLKILVGCWGLENNLERTRERLTAAGADKVGSSLLETREQMMPLIQFQSHIQHREEKLARVAQGTAPVG